MTGYEGESMADTGGGLGDLIAALAAFATAILISVGVVSILEPGDDSFGLATIIAGLAILAAWFVIILWQNQERRELFE